MSAYGIFKESASTFSLIAHHICSIDVAHIVAHSASFFATSWLTKPGCKKRASYYLYTTKKPLLCVYL